VSCADLAPPTLAGPRAKPGQREIQLDCGVRWKCPSFEGSPTCSTTDSANLSATTVEPEGKGLSHPSHPIDPI